MSSGPIVRSTLPLPTELIDEIVTSVISESLHTVCISTTDHPWEFRSIWTLAAVSYWFREIVINVVAKSFGICINEESEEQDKNSVLLVFKEQLITFHRAVVVRIRGTAPSLSIEAIDSYLLKTYSLFLAVRQLWVNAAQSKQAEVFPVTQKCIQTSMLLFGNLCVTIENRSATRIFLQAVDELSSLCNRSFRLADTSNTLREVISSLSRDREGETEAEDEPKIKVSEILDDHTLILEQVGEEYNAMLKSNILGITDMVWAYDLPGVSAAIDAVRNASLVEYGAEVSVSRCEELHKRWSEQSRLEKEVAESEPLADSAVAVGL